MGKGSFKYAWLLDKLKLSMSVVSPLMSPCEEIQDQQVLCDHN